MQKPDSLIFDMDGTLWDAVNMYTNSWNKILKTTLGKEITYNELLATVGWEGKKVREQFMPGIPAEQQLDIYRQVNEAELAMPLDDCTMYEGVKEGIGQLATKYQLFIVSNCAKGAIQRFMKWAEIDSYITDEVAYGINNMPKNHNIQLLIDKYHLKTPIYIGDTEGDSQQSRIAGIPFVFVTYGFGKTDDHDMSFDNFKGLTEYFMEL